MLKNRLLLNKEVLYAFIAGILLLAVSLVTLICSGFLIFKLIKPNSITNNANPVDSQTVNNAIKLIGGK